MKRSVSSCGRPEQLAEAPGADVAEDLHLPHPLRRVDEALGEEEVVGGVGVDVGDPGVVADHLDRRGEPGDVERPGRLRLRAGAHPGEQAADRHRPDDGDHEHDDEQDRQQAADDAHGVPLLLWGGPRPSAQCDHPAASLQRGPGRPARRRRRRRLAPRRRRGQRGRRVPIAPASARARIASAKTRSARPTPRWVTRPGRRAVAATRRGSPSRGSPPGPGSRRRARRRGWPGTGPPRRRRSRPAPRATSAATRRRVVDGDHERAGREPGVGHHLADGPERDAGDHDVGVVDGGARVGDRACGSDPGTPAASRARRRARPGRGRGRRPRRRAGGGRAPATWARPWIAGAHDRRARRPARRPAGPSGRSPSRRRPRSAAAVIGAAVEDRAGDPGDAGR